MNRSYLLRSVCGLLLANPVATQAFQVVVCETPFVAGGGQPVERFSVAGTNGALTRLSDIPGTAVNDPVSLAFDNRFELFVANRDAHRGNSDIARFVFDATFGTYTPNGTITGNGVTDAAQLAFNPIDGELFVTNWNTGVLSRFLFDAIGNALPNGTITMPDTASQLGIAIRPSDQQLFVSNYNYVRRFARQANGSYSHIGNFTLPAANSIHFMGFRGDELFVCDIATNAVHRFLFDANGNPMPNGTVPSASAVAVAFSPDQNEMFVARHFAGGFERFLYQPATDTWLPTAVEAGPQSGGIATTVHWYQSYGSGCPGVGAVVPTLQGYGIPRPGNTMNLRVQLGVPSNFALIAMSLAPGSVPVLGCNWLQSAHVGNTAIFALDAAGQYDYLFPIPAGFAPLDLYFQAFLIDLGANNGFFSTTAGLRATPR